MSDELVECTLKIPRSFLERDGKRYELTGEYRYVQAGEYALSGLWTGAVMRHAGGICEPRLIVREAGPAITPKPEPFLVTNGGEYKWAISEYPAYFDDLVGDVLYRPDWRRATPEELKALGLKEDTN